MKLTELHPRWYQVYSIPDAPGKGIIFDCPAHPNDENDFVAVKFSNPIGGLPAFPVFGVSDYRWQVVSGDSFENITISPSINYEGHWHGSLRNGELTGA